MWKCPKCGREFVNEGQHRFCTESPKTIADYIAFQPQEVQGRLSEVYETIKAAIPEATEKIAWQMPTFWQGQNLIHFAAFKYHIGLYPGGEATTRFADELTGFFTREGSIQLPYNRPLPVDLIARIAKWCQENNAI